MKSPKILQKKKHTTIYHQVTIMKRAESLLTKVSEEKRPKEWLIEVVLTRHLIESRRKKSLRT
jgi:hypothetical protein